MITGTLKSQVDRVWDAFWSGGISNPLEVIEQITYLLFLRRLDDLQLLAECKSLTGVVEDPKYLPDEYPLRWSRFKDLAPDKMHRLVGEQVFPYLRGLGQRVGGDGSTYGEHMRDARFTIPTPDQGRRPRLLGGRDPGPVHRPAAVRGGLAAHRAAGPRVPGHRDAQRARHGVRRLRPVGRRRAPAGRGRGQADDHERHGGAAAGQALRRLPGAPVRSAARHLLHQWLRALAVGRRGWLPVAPGAGLLHPRRAGAPGPTSADAAAAGRPRHRRHDRRAALPGAGHQGSRRRLRPQAARGPAGHGHRRGQDPHRDRACRPGASPSARSSCSTA